MGGGGGKMSKPRILLIKSQIVKSNQGRKRKFGFFPNDFNNTFQLVHEDREGKEAGNEDKLLK